jgi:hypothetical protein
MTTNGMSCERFTERLMDYLEYETDDATRSAIERHAVTCGDCGPLLADLRKLRIDAANMPELAPSRDLWAGIAARIETPVVAIGTRTESSGGRWVVPRRWMNRAMMAASLVAAAGLGYVAAARSRPAVTQLPVAARPVVDTVVITEVAQAQPDSARGAQPAASGTDDARLVWPPAAPAVGVLAAAPLPPTRPEVQRAIALLTADYDREIVRLRALIDQRRNQLDPATVAVIEKNLAVIDTAITESKQAIARDPASRFLIESLNQSLQAKVELMRTAAVLPSRT